ncbi:MAG: hypothetical protein IK031_03095 [Bacteroidales bacterium]|nr:hypothetical protein [Bacteroidales bacterium]
MAPSCGKVSPAGSNPREDVFVQADSSSFTVRFSVDDRSSDTLRPIRRLDVFAYDADGLHSLVLSRRYGFLPDSLLLYGPAKGMTVVAVANSPFDFNMDALDRYESAELLAYRFEDDTPSAPLMSGQGSVEADGTTIITLTPMLARVVLGEVSNELGNYLRLEDPRITMESMNASAELLRSSGFYPSETVPEPPVMRLPYDIGIFPQRPGTQLFCFPNDSQGAGIGTPATVFVFECEISGATRRFSVPLPSLRRNSTTFVDVTITANEELESTIY